EACLDHAEEVTRKTYRESLQQNREQILMSKALAIIANDAPLELSLDALRRDGPDPTVLRPLFQELGFTSLLKDLPSPEPAKADYAVLSDERSVQEFLGSLTSEPVAAFALSSAPVEEALTGGLAFDAAPELAIAPRAGVARVIPPALFPLAKALLE